MKEIIYLEIEDDYHHLGKCILNRLECENSSIVSLLHSRSASKFSLSLSGDSCYRLPLYHSLRCPAERFTKELGNTQTISKKVPILSSAIIQTADNYLLFARQTEYMNIYPKS